MMKRLMTLALTSAFAAILAAPAAAATPVTVTCAIDAAPASGEPANLHGNWDLLMDVGGELSFGLMSIGFVGDAYGGSLTPVRTAPVVFRDITVTGTSIHMTVASRDGDVLFDGTLSAKGDRMCGTVTYHGGQSFPMMAQKRPSAYPSPSQAERAE